MIPTQDLRQVVHEVMPAALDVLKQLISIPSISAPDYPLERIAEAAHFTEMQLKTAGFQQVRQLDLHSNYPAIYGEIPGPPNTPTVLLYAHYDVQPPGREQEWISPPFEPAVRDGRLYGRGSADDKSGVVAHLATVQALRGRLPVGIKVVIEGDEESSSSLPAYIPQHPDLFRANVVVICDHGSITAGQPTLTTSLRGSAALTVEVQTLQNQQHNGVFGGPVPDALVTLCRMIATLHDQHGNVHIPGLDHGSWQGADIPEDVLRRAAGLLPGVELIGNRSLSAQLWAGYSINIIGLDVPAIAGASNSLIDTARARINLRVPPDQSAERALRQLIQHIESITPWRAKVTMSGSRTSNGFVAKTDGPAYRAARLALKDAYGTDPQIIGDGASIPLTNVLSEQFPLAEILIWGTEDLAARIHGPNESVDLEELERIILTQALFLQQLTQQ